jgi:hypothetical protein
MSILKFKMATKEGSKLQNLRADTEMCSKDMHAQLFHVLNIACLIAKSLSSLTRKAGPS